MTASEARVQTEAPARYLVQLCKHFQHRRPVEIGERTGRIAFDSGVCTLAAEEGVLVMRCEAADAAQLGQLQDVVARHLLRFAFRSPPEIAWHDAA